MLHPKGNGEPLIGMTSPGPAGYAIRTAERARPPCTPTHDYQSERDE